MQFLRDGLISILLLSVGARQTLILGLSQSKRDACIALVANRYFLTNSTVAVITTSFQHSQQQPSIGLHPGSAGANIVYPLDLRWNFSFVILQLSLNNGTDCTCSDTLESFHAFQFFIIVGNGDEIATCIQQFCFVGLTEYRTRFVVYLNSEPANAERQVETVLEKFWEHNHQNVIVLVTNQKGDVDVYTWFPLKENSRAEIVNECNGQLFRHDTHLFPLKIPHDLNGKLLRVGITRTPPYTCSRIGGGYAGMDVEIIEAMASALNFTLDYVSVERLRRRNESEQTYWKGQMGPWKTILLRTVAGEVDIAIGGYNLEHKAIDVVGYTSPYYRDATRVFATSDLILAHDMERWIAMVLPVAALVHICTAVAMYLLKRRANSRRRDFGGSAMMVWSLITEESADTSKMSSRQALLWAVGAFYAINMNTAYKSLLTSVLARPLYVEKIQTVDDIVRYNIPYFLNGEPRKYPEAQLMSFRSREVIPVFLKRATCTEPLYRCLVKFLPVPHFSLYTYKLEMLFIQSSLPNRRYHTVSRDIHFSEISIYTRKNFFLTPKMSMMIHRFAHAGLINYWLTKSLKNFKLCRLNDSYWSRLHEADANASHLKRNPKNSHQPLSMERMEIQFWLLGIGLSVAGVFFIMEVLSMTKTYQLGCACFGRCC